MYIIKLNLDNLNAGTLVSMVRDLSLALAVCQSDKSKTEDDIVKLYEELVEAKRELNDYRNEEQARGCCGTACSGVDEMLECEGDHLYDAVERELREYYDGLDVDQNKDQDLHDKFKDFADVVVRKTESGGLEISCSLKEDDRPYYYETTGSGGPWTIWQDDVESDDDAVEQARQDSKSQGYDLMCVYRESDTEDGTPFEMIWEDDEAFAVAVRAAVGDPEVGEDVDEDELEDTLWDHLEDAPIEGDDGEVDEEDDAEVDEEPDGAYCVWLDCGGPFYLEADNDADAWIAAEEKAETLKGKIQRVLCQSRPVPKEEC